MPTVTIPNDWRPQPHQGNLWAYLRDGGKRAVAVWHRRAGKDSTALNWSAAAAHIRTGTYWHMLPEQAQARKVVWDGIDRYGRRMIDQAFPPEIRESTIKHEMKIELKCGSLWQCVGSDNYDSLIGSNPIGVVFSEYSVANPAAWDYIRPILAENGGWALFIYTARGRNHGARLYEMAKTNPSWFAERLTVDDTDVIGPEAVEEERAAGMSEDMIQQEFYCSFEAAIQGAYYGDLMNRAEADGRICDVPYDPRLPVQTWWDIGKRDATAIWFVQIAGTSFNVIDFYQNHGEGAEHYAKVLLDKPYTYAEPERRTGHLLPHDAKVSDWSIGGNKSRKEVLEGLGLKCRVVPRWSIEDGIQACRVLIPRCRFDQTRCAQGIEALRQYRQNWDEKNHIFSREPLHDWTSHSADAFRMGAVGVRDRIITPKAPVFEDDLNINDSLAKHLKERAAGRENAWL